MVKILKLSSCDSRSYKLVSKHLHEKPEDQKVSDKVSTGVEHGPYVHVARHLSTRVIVEERLSITATRREIQWL